MPMAPPGNWTISLYITSERPSILATPSATERMVPVFFLTALVESLAICCSICSRTVLMSAARVGGLEKSREGVDQVEAARVASWLAMEDS